MLKQGKYIVTLLFAIVLLIFPITAKADSSSWDVVQHEKLSKAEDLMSSSTKKSFSKFYDKVEQLEKDKYDTQKYTGEFIYYEKGVAIQCDADSKIGGCYYGELKNGYPEGFGCIAYNGEYIFADFKKGKISGYAMLVNVEADYTIYKAGTDCYLKKDRSGDLYIEGTSVEIKAKTGDDDKVYLLYEGNMKKSKRDGSGTEYAQNGKIVYEGSFLKDLYSGKGKEYYSDGQLKYKGNYSKGKYDGKGTLYNADGSVKHKGKFKAGNIK